MAPKPLNMQHTHDTVWYGLARDRGNSGAFYIALHIYSPNLNSRLSDKSNISVSWKRDEINKCDVSCFTRFVIYDNTMGVFTCLKFWFLSRGKNIITVLINRWYQAREIYINHKFWLHIPVHNIHLCTFYQSFCMQMRAPQSPMYLLMQRHSDDKHIRKIWWICKGGSRILKLGWKIYSVS